MLVTVVLNMNNDGSFNMAQNPKVKAKLYHNSLLDIFVMSRM
jgi:hypothetical protein